MTATIAERGRTLPRRGGAGEAHDLPALSPRQALARAFVVFLGAVAAAIVLQLAVLSTFQERASQQRSFDAFRSSLAKGTAPIGPLDANNHLLKLGTPVAYLEIPSIGVRQVVVEGTTSSALFKGPGHRRDTPLPGQPGTSLIAGRRAAYGGPFEHIGSLKAGATIHVTTGQGAFDYKVIDVRHAGDPLPAAYKSGSGRLVLATAAGRPFMPSDVAWVDADLATPAVGSPGGRIATAALPAAEKLMAMDSSTLWALALWLQALFLILVGGIWAWQRWDRAKAWMVCLPPLVLVSLSTAGEVAKFLPNLL